MPTYCSVVFQYERAAIHSTYVRDLYTAMLQNGFVYGGVLAWGCPADLSLDDVIHWNQALLEKDFNLGSTEDVSKGYRQIFLLHPHYSECRVFIINSYQTIHLIVPEDEFFPDSYPEFAQFFVTCPPEPLYTWMFRKRVEPLLVLACTIWRTGLVNSVQTTDEGGDWTDITALEGGEPPSLLPFGIVQANWSGVDKVRPFAKISPIDGDGLLIEQYYATTLPD